MKLFGDYNPDEALRITSVTAMLEGDSYIFNVRNSGGTFTTMLMRHEYPQGFFEKDAKCCENVADPCSAQSKNLKDAIRQSIAMHQKFAHYLKVVS